MPFRQYWKCLSASKLPGLKLPIAKKRLPYGFRHKQSLGTAFNRAPLQLARLASYLLGGWSPFFPIDFRRCTSEHPYHPLVDCVPS